MKKDKKLKFFGIPKLYPYIKPHIKLIIFMLIIGAGISVTDIAIPVFQKYALDNYIVKNTLDSIWIFSLIYLFAILFAGTVDGIATLISSKVEALVKRDLRNRAFKHLQTLSFSYFNQNSVGYIHSRVMSDINNIGELVSWVLLEILWQTIYIVGAIVVMMSINAKLTLLICTIIPIVAILYFFFDSKLIKVNREIRKLNSEITSDFNEEITGVKTVKTLAIEEKMNSSFNKDTSKIKKKSIKSAHIRGLFTGFMGLASSLALAIVLWKGGIIDSSEVGTFSLFMSYATGMMEPIRYIVECVSDLIMTEVNIERLTNLLSTESDVKDTAEVVEKYGDVFNPKRENWEEIKGDIEFKDVSFKYPDGDEYVLSHFNLKIPFGTNVAIVGETGAGKSTLVNLICRFYEPTEGKVLIDCKDARERSTLWLHSSIGYVLQTPHLFSGTVRYNLLYGNENATDEEIYRALELVCARDIVDRMEKGLDSDVGEGGDLLSAGEKQLISFARAILKNPKILILDEATASVDTLTEQKIQSALNTVIKGRTSVVIAHRLSTVRTADIILVAKNGEIIERGTHEELIEKGGYYYNLYKKQYDYDATASLLNG